MQLSLRIRNKNRSRDPDAYYEPNSFNGPKEDPRFAEPPLPLQGDADRYNHRDANDDHTQAVNLWGGGVSAARRQRGVHTRSHQCVVAERSKRSRFIQAR